MKLSDILLLGLALAFIIIGIDQTIVLGFNHAYWAFMAALTLFFVFNFKKNKQKQEARQQGSSEKKGATKPVRKK
ncbi:MAG TPA: hypothetical protein VD884_22270 [Ohtaekwangia sp.]|nr:hypothetical protein [Ohtaekwangia sp.]